MDTKFWLGFGLGCLGFVLLIWEVATEPELIKRPAWIWLLSLAACFVGFDVFATTLINPIAPLDIICYSPRQGEYAAGTLIDGIEWDSHFTELRAGITDNSDDEYENLDLTIQPDAWTHKAVIPTQVDGCEVRPLGGNALVATISKGGATSVSARKIGGDTEVHDNAGDVFVTLANSDGYRLRCDKLPSHSTVKVVFALVAVPSQLMLHQPGHPEQTVPGAVYSEIAGAKSLFELLGPKPSPAQVEISGRYRRNKQPFSLQRILRVGD